MPAPRRTAAASTRSKLRESPSSSQTSKTPSNALSESSVSAENSSSSSPYRQVLRRRRNPNLNHFLSSDNSNFSDTNHCSMDLVEQSKVLPRKPQIADQTLNISLASSQDTSVCSVSSLSDHSSFLKRGPPLRRVEEKDEQFCLSIESSEGNSQVSPISSTANGQSKLTLKKAQKRNKTLCLSAENSASASTLSSDNTFTDLSFPLPSKRLKRCKVNDANLSLTMESSQRSEASVMEPCFERPAKYYLTRKEMDVNLSLSMEDSSNRSSAIDSSDQTPVVDKRYLKRNKKDSELLLSLENSVQSSNNCIDLMNNESTIFQRQPQLNRQHQNDESLRISLESSKEQSIESLDLMDSEVVPLSQRQKVIRKAQIRDKTLNLSLGSSKENTLASDASGDLTNCEMPLVDISKSQKKKVICKTYAQDKSLNLSLESSKEGSLASGTSGDVTPRVAMKGTLIRRRKGGDNTFNLSLNSSKENSPIIEKHSPSINWVESPRKPLTPIVQNIEVLDVSLSLLKRRKILKVSNLPINLSFMKGHEYALSDVDSINRKELAQESCQSLGETIDQPLAENYSNAEGYDKEAKCKKKVIKLKRKRDSDQILNISMEESEEQSSIFCEGEKESTFSESLQSAESSISNAVLNEEEEHENNHDAESIKSNELQSLRRESVDMGETFQNLVPDVDDSNASSGRENPKKKVTKLRRNRYSDQIINVSLEESKEKSVSLCEEEKESTLSESLLSPDSSISNGESIKSNEQPLQNPASYVNDFNGSNDKEKSKLKREKNSDQTINISMEKSKQKSMSFCEGENKSTSSESLQSSDSCSSNAVPNGEVEYEITSVAESINSNELRPQRRRSLRRESIDKKKIFQNLVPDINDSNASSGTGNSKRKVTKLKRKRNSDQIINVSMEKSKENFMSFCKEEKVSTSLQSLNSSNSISKAGSIKPNEQPPQSRQFLRESFDEEETFQNLVPDSNASSGREISTKKVTKLGRKRNSDQIINVSMEKSIEKFMSFCEEEKESTSSGSLQSSDSGISNLVASDNVEHEQTSDAESIKSNKQPPQSRWSLTRESIHKGEIFQNLVPVVNDSNSGGRETLKKKNVTKLKRKRSSDRIINISMEESKEKSVSFCEDEKESTSSESLQSSDSCASNPVPNDEVEHENTSDAESIKLNELGRSLTRESIDHGRKGEIFQNLVSGAHASGGIEKSKNVSKLRRKRDSDRIIDISLEESKGKFTTFCAEEKASTLSESLQSSDSSISNPVPNDELEHEQTSDSESMKSKERPQSQRSLIKESINKKEIFPNLLPDVNDSHASSGKEKSKKKVPKLKRKRNSDQIIDISIEESKEKSVTFCEEDKKSTSSNSLQSSDSSISSTVSDEEIENENTSDSESIKSIEQPPQNRQSLRRESIDKGKLFQNLVPDVNDSNAYNDKGRSRGKSVSFCEEEKEFTSSEPLQSSDSIISNAVPDEELMNENTSYAGSIKLIEQCPQSQRSFLMDRTAEDLQETCIEVNSRQPAMTRAPSVEYLKKEIEAIKDRVKAEFLAKMNLKNELLEASWKKPPKKASVNPAKPKVRREPIKLYKPASWANRRLYNFLIAKLKPHYGLDSVNKAQNLVKLIFNTFNAVVKSKNYEKVAVDKLKEELAVENIIITTNDFYSFVRQFLPFEFEKNVIPCVQPFTNIVWPPKDSNLKAWEPILKIR